MKTPLNSIIQKNSFKKAKCAKGFTLLEVMLSMAVFAIAGVALLSTANTNIINLNSFEERIIASWVASNQLVEAKLSNQWPPENNEKGSSEISGQVWHWQQQALKTADDNLRQITVEVRIAEADEKSIASLVTFVTRKN